jgi:hypothetical protein
VYDIRRFDKSKPEYRQQGHDALRAYNDLCSPHHRASR